LGLQPGPRHSTVRKIFLMFQVQTVEVADGKNGAPGAKKPRWCLPFFPVVERKNRNRTIN